MRTRKGVCESLFNIVSIMRKRLSPLPLSGGGLLDVAFVDAR